MDILDWIFKPLFGIALFFVVLFLIKDISYTLKLIKTINKTKANLERWMKGNINLDDINSLTPHEFEYWCGEFISNLGYSNIKQTPKGPDGGKDITCKFHGKTAYVECKRYWFSSSSIHKVDEQICRKLTGAMVHDQISYGLIITSGIISDECQDYTRALPNGHKIKLIDGSKIVELYSMLHSKQQVTAQEQKG